MRTRVHPNTPSNGFRLIELLVVLAILGICVAIGVAAIGRSLDVRAAKEAASCWQAAAAWAQAAVLWQHQELNVGYEDGQISTGGEAGSASALPVGPVPATGVDANVARWKQGRGVSVGFGGSFAAPDGGGSLYFGGGPVEYRVVVRPESGLTGRTLVETGQ